LGTCTRFARDRADLHHTVVNLRHFVLEQTTQEIAVRPREDNLWAARAILDLQHHRPDAFMYLESLPGDPLVRRQYAFGLHVEPNGGGLGIGRLNDPTDNLADLALKILHLVRTFRLTDPLLDDLAGRLRGHTTEIGRCGFHNDHIAQLRVRIHLTRLLQQDFGFGLLYVFDHFFLGKDRDLT